MSAESEAISAAGKAVERISDPRVFPVAVALIAMIGFGALVALNREDQREDRALLLAAMDRNTAAVSELSHAVQALELAAAKSH